MSVAYPLTASNDITRVPQANLSPVEQGSPAKLNLGNFADDILNISKQGREKQQAEQQIQTNNQNKVNEVEKIKKEIVSVSSTIGRAKSSGALSTKEALALYNKIASLL